MEKKETLKMSYEELESKYKELSGILSKKVAECEYLLKENNNLKRQAGDINRALMLDRLKFLFSVVTNKDSFNSTFTEKCAKEIELMLFDDGKNEQDGE